MTLGIISSYLVVLFQNESVQNLSYENQFDLHEIEPVDEAHFYMKTRFDTEAKKKKTHDNQARNDHF